MVPIEYLLLSSSSARGELLRYGSRESSHNTLSMARATHFPFLTGTGYLVATLLQVFARSAGKALRKP